MVEAEGRMGIGYTLLRIQGYVGAVNAMEIDVKENEIGVGEGFCN